MICAGVDGIRKGLLVSNMTTIINIIMIIKYVVFKTSGLIWPYQKVNDTQERPLMLQAVLPICPNKPSVFINFRPAYPRVRLAALMLAGLNYIDI